MTYIP